MPETTTTTQALQKCATSKPLMFEKLSTKIFDRLPAAVHCIVQIELRVSPTKSSK